MSQTAHAALRDQVVACFQVDPPLAGGRVFGARRRALPSSAFEQILVAQEQSEADRGLVSGGIDWATRVRITAQARTTADAEADVAADSLAEEAFARLMAPQALAPGDVDVVPLGAQWVDDEEDPSVSAVHLMFEIRHRCGDQSIAAE